MHLAWYFQSWPRVKEVPNGIHRAIQIQDFDEQRLLASGDLRFGMFAGSLL